MPSDVDALLVLSFGGPEGPADVMPFLERVTCGRGVPRERLLEVAHHYDHFGGVSPINQLNRELIDRVRTALDAAGISMPVYFGNRNWHPLVEETVAEMANDGIQRALVLATSAYGGYSACRQYHEDIERAREAVGPAAPELIKLRHFFDHPYFVASVADGARAALTRLEPSQRDQARLVFTAHSIPTAADRAAGPPSQGGHRYSRQVAEAARLVAQDVGIADYDVVWQSRSGPPSVPWLEPDILDHLEALRAKAVPAVVISPVGFVSDHVEVVWDLDNEAREWADEHGIGFARAATAGADDRFAAMVVELVREQTEGLPARSVGSVPTEGAGINGAPCGPDCCLPVRRPHSPAAQGSERRPATVQRSGN